MNILVTGATGFLGGHLVEYLVANNHEVICMIRKTSNTKLLDELGVETRIGDLGDPYSMKSVVKNVELTYHLGSYYTFLGKKEYYVKYNELGVKALLEACEDAGVARFIYCSSAEAVGAVPFCETIQDYATEEAPYNPQYEYGRSKVRTEKIVKDYNSEIDWTILRPTGVYGPRNFDDVAYWLIEALAKNKISVWFRVRNSGTIHFTYIDDVIQGFDLARKEVAKNQIFNIASDTAKSVDEVMQVICYILGRKLPRFALPKLFLKSVVVPIQVFNAIRGKPEFFLRTAAVDSVSQHRCYSNQKAKDLLGFAPKYDIETGLTKTINWYKENEIL
ncbi:MAG: NAD-dependent epimerase/dehydratase family protein [Candidatus Hodarchaeota archaeon]